MMKCNLVVALLTGSFLILWADRPTAAQTGTAKTATAKASAEDSPGDETTDAPKPKSSKFDPVASAFTLPPRVVLNEDQQAALDKLKEDKSPTLREALDKARQATSVSERLAAQGEIKKLRAEIHAAVLEIVRGPSSTVGKPAPTPPAAQKPPVDNPPVVVKKPVGTSEDQERRRLDEEKRKTEEAKRRLDEEKRKTEEAKRRLDEEKRKTEEAKRRFDEEKRKADDARRKADDARRKADEEKRRAEEQRRRNQPKPKK
jgi:hypothetical protein